MAGNQAGVPSRRAAARAVALVLGEGATLESALARAVAEAPELPPRERSQAQALAFGAVRWHHRHRALLTRLLHKPLPDQDRRLEALLSVGLFQLREDSQPDYAAVDATVGACSVLGVPGLAGVVNATLRRHQRERPALDRAIETDDEARHAHPRWLLDCLRQDWPDAWRDVVIASQQRPPLWLRVNRRRAEVPVVRDRLAREHGALSDESALAPCALRLLARGGRLLYSTCSVPRAENETVVDGFLAAQSDALEVPLAVPAGLFAVARGLQLLPGGLDADGFYYALMEKA